MQGLRGEEMRKQLSEIQQFIVLLRIVARVGRVGEIQ